MSQNAPQSFHDVFERMTFDIALLQGMSNLLTVALSGEDPDLDFSKICSFASGMERLCDQLALDHATLFKHITQRTNLAA